jgi:hypothetical protein
MIFVPHFLLLLFLFSDLDAARSYAASSEKIIIFAPPPIIFPSRHFSVLRAREI